MLLREDVQPHYAKWPLEQLMHSESDPEGAEELLQVNEMSEGVQILALITPRAHARARGYVIGRGVHILY